MEMDTPEKTMRLAEEDIKRTANSRTQGSDPIMTIPSRNLLWHRLSFRILIGLVLVALALKLVDAGFIELNRRKVVLPHFDVRLLPYHDQRFTRCESGLLAYKTPPPIIFTGDSRVWNGFNPEVTSQTLGVRPEMFFNFGGGHQTIDFARRVFVPHLLELGQHPRYLVFGVTPDWMLAHEDFYDLNKLYKQSLAYRLKHGGTDGNDRVETLLSEFLSRHLALYRYRADLINQEILPDFKCWLGKDCGKSFERGYMSYREINLLDSIQTQYGWGPQAIDGKTSGLYLDDRRFTEKDLVDREGLVALIRQVKQAGITPVFLIMPTHPSFIQAHEPALSRNYQILKEVTKEEGVDLITATGDYSDPRLFVDGHHLSHRGADYFSADIAPALLSYVQKSKMN